MSNEADPISGLDATKNSPLRDSRFARPLNGAARWLHKEFPWLLPNHITVGGNVLVSGGAIYAYFNPVAGAAIATVTSFTDALDGRLRRVIDLEDPHKLDSSHGPTVDAISDRYQEWFLAMTRMVVASAHGDQFGKWAAYAAAITNTWTSVARAYCEANQISVSESGPIAIKGVGPGTRFGRAGLGLFGLGFRQINGFPVQGTLDTITAVSNVVTTIDRLRHLKQDKPNPDKITDRKVNEALERIPWLNAFGLFAIASSTAVAILIP